MNVRPYDDIDTWAEDQGFDEKVIWMQARTDLKNLRKHMKEIKFSRTATPEVDMELNEQELNYQLMAFVNMAQALRDSGPVREIFEVLRKMPYDVLEQVRVSVARQHNQYLREGQFNKEADQQ